MAAQVRGADCVGDGAAAFGLLVVLPFVVLVVGGVAKGGIDPSLWLAGPPPEGGAGEGGAKLGSPVQPYIVALRQRTSPKSSCDNYGNMGEGNGRERGKTFGEIRREIQLS